MIRAGVIGHPVSHSLSPRIHNRWFEETEIDGRYEAIDARPEDFVEAVRRAAGDGFVALNVTIPHKEKALEIADEASPSARAIGAANLLVFRDGKIFAENTDWCGFAEAVEREGGSLAGDTAVVLGAGGAAAGILYALQDFENVLLANRTRARAEALAGRFPNVTVVDWEKKLELGATESGLFVNTTSLGMAGYPTLGMILGDPGPAMVVDIVYAPMETKLIRAARKAGKPVANGLSMLVWQAVPSFEAFAGIPPKRPAATLADLEAELS
ncbi:shikimate dehydrogenase [Parvularcula lutaonensis]|uniref:Shikimate dehydrogenase (NADP(+)) n=1 Tax=Parvularcula lutaonensis TaxID=491923 RepID=A0ABV7MBB3_9PROT|nr:shikimate dehydrogenase [Parvularcula lutaonensis]GGY46512.1 shikimate dehydrogenase (NADP(+)) [Parvularcula lutaonensis]